VKRTFTFIITVFAICGQMLCAGKLAAQDADAAHTDANVAIKFFDRTMYYPGDPDTNPVYIHVTITNTTSKQLRFKLADDRMFSIDFIAYTIKNGMLPHTESLDRKRTTNQTVYFREISLGPGESYSFVENIKEYLSFTEPSIYYVELGFYPEMYKERQLVMRSNRLVLEIKPSPSAAAVSQIGVKNKTAEILKPQEIAPDRVVEQTIVARQKSLWDQYFLYMNLEEMLQRDPMRKKIYRSVSANERTRMIENYKTDLMQSHIDIDIVAIPESFQIERTTYSQTEGSVSVIEWFKYKTYREKKRYTYHIRQRDGIWQIYDYSVDNLGTE